MNELIDISDRAIESSQHLIQEWIANKENNSLDDDVYREVLVSELQCIIGGVLGKIGDKLRIDMDILFFLAITLRSIISQHNNDENNTSSMMLKHSIISHIVDITKKYHCLSEEAENEILPYFNKEKNKNA